MCGICGEIGLPVLADPPGARQRVEAMLHDLRHRGPDDVGLTATPSAVLGATRLAIRGIHHGHQPIAAAGDDVVVVCNGEIDNHRELRRWLEQRGRAVPADTDVAVIPGLYLELGDAFVQRLVGAFAVAVWDGRAQRLLLARDRAGERPLFFGAVPGGVVFATELRALTAQRRLPVTLSLPALRRYLQFGIFIAPDTPFAEVHKVAPGEIVQFDAAGVRRQTYWHWPVGEVPKQAPSLDAFDRVFREAVGRQSDVEVDFGVFLSGGVDSSLVSATVRALHPRRPIRAYTLRFSEASFDEGAPAAAVAKRLRLDLATLWVRPAEVRRAVIGLVRSAGEPLADPAWAPAGLLAARAAEDITVALVGEGADEIFGGYPTYLGAGLAARYARLPLTLRRLFRRAVDALPPSEKKVTVSFLLKRFMQGTDLDGLARHRLWVSNVPPPLLERLGLTATLDRSTASQPPDLLDQLQRWDLETSLAEGLLTKADRASMISALELRAPFLDVGVLEFAASLPAAERARGWSTKVFLKRYAVRLLPRDIVYRRKRGLSVPVGAWLRGPWRDWAESLLANPRLEQVGLQPGAARALLADQLERRADHARALWTLMVLSEWLDWVAEATARGVVAC